MNLPTLHAGLKTRTPFRTRAGTGVVPSRAIQRMSSRLGGGGLKVRGFPGALNFSCDWGACECTGDDDCLNMFNSGVCGGVAVCDGSSGEVKCECLRF